MPLEDYADAFLAPFGIKRGEEVLWADVTGTRIPISEDFLKSRDGKWKVLKRGREVYAQMMAQTLLDPDEVWIGVAAKGKTDDPRSQDWLYDRRYIRAFGDFGLVAVMEIGRKWWEPVTIYLPDRDGKPSLNTLDGRRGGKLLWSKKKRRPG